MYNFSIALFYLFPFINSCKFLIFKNLKFATFVVLCWLFEFFSHHFPLFFQESPTATVTSVADSSTIAEATATVMTALTTTVATLPYTSSTPDILTEPASDVIPLIRMDKQVEELSTPPSFIDSDNGDYDDDNGKIKVCC